MWSDKNHQTCKWSSTMWRKIQRLGLTDDYPTATYVTSYCRDSLYMLVVDTAPVRRCFMLHACHAIVSVHVVMELLSQCEFNWSSRSVCHFSLLYRRKCLVLNALLYMLSVCWNDAFSRIFNYSLKEVNQFEFSRSVLGRLNSDICKIYIDGDLYGL